MGGFVEVPAQEFFAAPWTTAVGLSANFVAQQAWWKASGVRAALEKVG